MVGADLAPGKSHFVKWFYKPGVYEVKWIGRSGKDQRGVRLFIDDNVTLIEFTDTGNGVIHIRMEKAK